MADEYNWHATNLSPEQFTDREVKGVKVNEDRLVICRTGNEFFALDGICPHAGAGLAGGWCSSQRDSIVCPLHRYEFDLETGKELTGKGLGLGTYPVKVEDGKLFVGFKRKRWIFF